MATKIVYTQGNGGSVSGGNVPDLCLNDDQFDQIDDQIVLNDAHIDQMDRPG